MGSTYAVRDLHDVVEPVAFSDINSKTFSPSSELHQRPQLVARSICTDVSLILFPNQTALHDLIYGCGIQ